MQRIIESRLIKWKDSQRRKPLIIRGARQVGKTWTIEWFGNNYFSNFYKIDLEKRTDLHSIFNNNLDPQRILSLLEISFNCSFNSLGFIFFN